MYLTSMLPGSREYMTGRHPCRFAVIIGLGQTGLSCVKFCLRENLNFAVTDSRHHPPEEKSFKKIAPNIEMHLGKLSEKLIERADVLIVSPGVSLKEPLIARAIERGTQVIGDVELFVREIKTPIVAITGSNAKSTVVALVGDMAKRAGINAQVAGNIGIPVLSLLEKARADLTILELSSFQLETTQSLQATVATILNVSEDHMDRYDSLKEYIAAKKRIYQNCQTAVVNLSDSRIWPDSTVRQIGFSLNKPKQNEFGLSESSLAYGDEKLIEFAEIKLRGLHNVENALAALAIGKALKFKQTAMLQTLKTFSGLPHRCQFVRERDGVTWYNDSKGTNVGATIAALKGLTQKKNIILIVGGQSKGADFTPLKEPVSHTVRQLILLGEDAAQLERALRQTAPVQRVKTLSEAVAFAQSLAKKGDIILLSPACASFDMFENYAHRGEVFEKLVRQL